MSRSDRVDEPGSKTRAAIDQVHVIAWRDGAPVPIPASNVRDIARLVDGPELVWVDLAGPAENVEQLLRELSEHSRSFDGLDPAKASTQERDPSQRPPKAKAFLDFIFARAYWLHLEPERPTEVPPHLVAQQLHILAGRTFVITIRYGCLAWDMDAMGVGGDEQPVPIDHRGLDTARLEAAITGFRKRVPEGDPQRVFGLEVASVVLDMVTDSIFVSLDELRQVADQMERRVLRKDWVWDRKQWPIIDERLSGLRRLLRRVRWAFLPSDEIDELTSGPFLDVCDTDTGIGFRLDDLSREANRAVMSVADVLTQVQEVVTLRDGIKNDRLSDTTYALTVVATVLLVPTLLAGIYGMNVGLPLAHERYSFGEVLAMMVVLGAGVWFGTTRLLRRQASKSASRSR